jgi:hypothetical protein
MVRKNEPRRETIKEALKTGWIHALAENKRWLRFIRNPKGTGNCPEKRQYNITAALWKSLLDTLEPFPSVFPILEPGNIEGYKPDIVIARHGPKFLLIGEVEANNDFETARSRVFKDVGKMPDFLNAVDYQMGLCFVAYVGFNQPSKNAVPPTTPALLDEKKFTKYYREIGLDTKRHYLEFFGWGANPQYWGWFDFSKRCGDSGGVPGCNRIMFENVFERKWRCPVHK